MKKPDLKNMQWMNSEKMSLEEMKGKAVLINFWNYTNAACLRGVPYVKSYYEKYKNYAHIIGAHVPLFNFERVKQNVEMAIERMGIKYPVFMDNDREAWNAFDIINRPSFIILDGKGEVRYRRANEGGYSNLEKNLQNIIKEISPKVKLPEIMQEERGVPTMIDINTGYLTGMIGNPEGFVYDQIVMYNDTEEHYEGFFYLNGMWQNEEQLVMHANESTNLSEYISLPYRAYGVNAVLAPEKGVPTKVYVMQDGLWLDDNNKGKDVQFDERKRSYVKVEHPRLYRIVDNKEIGKHELKLATDDYGLGVYQFSFNSCPLA